MTTVSNEAIKSGFYFLSMFAFNVGRWRKQSELDQFQTLQVCFITLESQLLHAEKFH